MRLSTACAAAALSMLATLGSSQATTAKNSNEAARFTYEGYVGGIKIGTAVADIAFGPEHYAAKMNLETGGLVGLFYKWSNGSEAYGGSEPTGDAPLSLGFYRNGNVWKGKDRFVEVVAADGMAEIKRAVPHPVRDEGRPPVAPQLLKNVLDPISALAAIGRVIEDTGSCKTSFGVFDGRRRYQLKITDQGETEVGRSRTAPFGGNVRKCAFVFEPVAGFKDKKKAKRQPTTGLAYFRSARKGAPLMPVQIIADSSYGKVILHLNEVELLDPVKAAQASAMSLAEDAARKLGDSAPR